MFKHVRTENSNAIMEDVNLPDGYVTETMIVEITVMKRVVVC